VVLKLKIMNEEKTVYFVEQKATGKWYAGIKKGCVFYTNDPLKAVQFLSKIEAKNACDETEIVTEHIFVESTQTFI